MLPPTAGDANIKKEKGKAMIGSAQEIRFENYAAM